jgi:hypothetical protein
MGLVIAFPAREFYGFGIEPLGLGSVVKAIVVRLLVPDTQNEYIPTTTPFT